MGGEGREMKTTRSQRLSAGLSLTEMLVVLAIMVILMAILVPALGAFTHTSRVIGAADTMAKVLREARYRAMNEGVPVVPVILRDRAGKFTITYASKAMQFRGGYGRDWGLASWGPPGYGVPGSPNPFSMLRPQVDA